MKHQKKVQSIVEAMGLVIAPAELPKAAIGRRVAWIIALTMPGMDQTQLLEGIKALGERPDILAEAYNKTQELQLQQSVIARAWSRISSNLPWA